MIANTMHDDYYKRKDEIIFYLTFYHGVDIPEEIKEKINRHITIVNRVTDCMRKSIVESGALGELNYSDQKKYLNEKYPLFKEI